MNFVDRLLGRFTDPTLGWGSFNMPIPDFDVTEMRLGTLRFGHAFDSAAFLGRPDRCQQTQSNYCELLYAAGGFQIDFSKGKFAYLAFFIGPDNYLPKHRALEFSKPRLCGCTPEGVRLSRSTDRMVIEKLFGGAESVDTGPKEVIFYYTRQNVTMEFEMNAKSGMLKRWNLYPK